MEIIKINQKNYQETLPRVAQLIQKGKIFVCPTDTVYGLVCDATNEKAVKWLFKIKRRPRRKSIPIFVKDLAMARGLAFIDESQELFLRNNWPGPVTAILKSKNKLPKILGTEKTIGLRIPNYKFINDILKKINRPLTGTSANISGHPSCWSAKAVIMQFQNRKYKPDFLIDAGQLSRRKPSKVIDLTVFPPKILRF